MLAKSLVILVFYLLIPNTLSSADLGLNLGSKAAGKLATHCIHYALRQPRVLKLNLQSSVNPWFEKVAHVTSQTKLSLSNFTIQFENDMVELALYDVVLKSTSQINIMPLPFFLGEDTAHLYAEIPHASLKLDVRDFDVKLHECVLETVALDVSLDRAFLMNLFLKPLHSLLPRSMVEESLCSSIADSLSVFENRFALWVFITITQAVWEGSSSSSAECSELIRFLNSTLTLLEIGLAQLVPDRFREYLVWPNSTLFAQLASAEAKDATLSVRIVIDWQNNEELLGSTTEETITFIEPTTTNSSPAPPLRSTELIIDDGTSHWIEPTTESFTELTLRDQPLVLSGANLEFGPDRVTVWVEDKLLNELFKQFRWDFEWMTEDIPVDSPKLPSATRDFLSTLCTDCHFELRVSANGSPHIAAVNESIVLEKSDRIFLKVVNPVRNVTSVFVSFYLTLNIQLRPKIEEGIFKTEVDLLDTQIKMEKGAFPSAWNFFVQNLVKDMIMDVIWPGLKEKIEHLSYSDGVEIPATCGMEPETAELHFTDERFGASTALKLDDVSLADNAIQLTTTNNDDLSMIAGFTARFQCSIYRCSWDAPTIAWYKDDILIFNGTDFIPSSGFEPGNIVLQRTASPEYQSRNTCVTEDYSLLIKNITIEDSGRYRCQLQGFPQQLDFQLHVLEGGLKPGFHENITFDHTQCCLERGISPLCRGICKPRDLYLDFFDPTSCKTSDYKNFLYCATNGGQKNYINCCRSLKVPSFCFDFCSNNFRMLKRSHKLCLYYFPEILQCFNEKSSLYPESPTNLHIVSDSSGLELCWNVDKSNEQVNYSVHIKDVSSTVLHGNVSLANESKSPIMIDHESTINQMVDFRTIPSENIKKVQSNYFCIQLINLKPESHYIAYVQATNTYGVSEPSSPLFITTGKQQYVQRKG